jgi:CheY-like chemotaxis protein
VVLLVEDDPGDQILTQEAFKTLKVPHELRVVSDGKEALDYLYQQGAHEAAGAPKPDLILLDLNMPRMNGQQVAERIHADPQLCQIPIIVLTTSRRQEDVLRAYGRGVTRFISKPLDFQHLLVIVGELERLLKLTVATKTLRARRVTDRQIRRIARRQRQLEHVADALFDYHMQQIENVFSEGAPACDPEFPGGGAPSEAGTQEGLARLASRILKEEPAASAEPRREHLDRTSIVAWPHEQWADHSDTAGDLLKLAESLDAIEKHEGALPRAARAHASKVNRP